MFIEGLVQWWLPIYVPLMKFHDSVSHEIQSQWCNIVIENYHLYMIYLLKHGDFPFFNVCECCRVSPPNEPLPLVCLIVLVGWYKNPRKIG